MFKIIHQRHDEQGLQSYLFHMHCGGKQVYLTLERGKAYPMLRTNGVKAYDSLTFARGKKVWSCHIDDFYNSKEVENKLSLFASSLM